MNRLVRAALLVAIVQFPLSGYVFLKGAGWGMERYRHSEQFMMTLFSMYRFGVIDGCTNPRTCRALGVPKK